MSAGSVTPQEIFLVSGRNVGDVITVNGTAYTVGTENSYASVSDAVEADAFTTSNADAVIFTNLSTTTQDVSSLNPFFAAEVGANFIFNGTFSGSLQETQETGSNPADIVLLTFSGSDTVCSFSVYAPLSAAVENSIAYSTVEKGAELTVDEARFVPGSELLVTGTGSEFNAAALSVTGSILTASSGGTISFAGGTISGYNGKVTAEKDSFLSFGGAAITDDALISGEQATITVTDDVTISDGGTLALKDSQLSSSNADAVIILDGGRIEVNGDSEFDFSSGDIVLAADSSGNEIIVSGAGSLKVDTLNASAAGSGALDIRLVITEETVADQVMLTVGDLAGEWSLTEENYKVWEGTPVNVQLTLGGELDFIDQRYKLMDAKVEYRNINFNITQEMADLGYCVIRTADGIYLSERKIDMSTIIVNSEWAGKSDGEAVTYNGETYTIGTNAFETYETIHEGEVEIKGAVETIKQQTEKPVSIIVNTPGSAITFSEATVNARFSGGKSVVTDVTVTAGEIGVSWDGSLTYTGSVTGTFEVDFANFSDADLDKKSAYVLLYGAEATGTCSATTANTKELTSGWNFKAESGTVYMWNDALFTDADLVIDPTLSSPNKKLGYAYEVNGKEYIYGLTAYADVALAKGSEYTTSSPASVTFVGDTKLVKINELSAPSDDKKWKGIDITVTGDLSFDTGIMSIGQSDGAIGTLKVQGKISGSNREIKITCDGNTDKLLTASGIEGIDTITATVTGETGNDKISLGAIIGGSGENVMEIISSDVTAISITGNVKISGNLNVKDVSRAGEITAGSIVVSGGSALTVNDKLVIEDGGNTASKVTNLITTDSGDGAAELLLSASDTLTISNLTVKKDLTIGDTANGYTGLVLLTGKNTSLTVDAGKTLTISADQATRFTKFKNYTIGNDAKIVIRGGAMSAEEMDNVKKFYRNKNFKDVTFEDTILSDVANVTIDTLDEVSDFFTSGTFSGTVSNNKLDIAKGEDGDLSDYSYDMMGGKNTVNIGNNGLLEMIDLINVTTLTVSNGTSGDNASTGLTLSGVLITSPSAATVKVGNFTTTEITGEQQEDGSYVAIGKSPLGGNNTISFGNGSSVKLGGDLIAVKSLTLGNGTANDGQAELTVGAKDTNGEYIEGSGNIYGQNINNTIKTGTWSVTNIYGSIELDGGTNTIAVGAYGIFNTDDIQGVKTFTIGNGGLNKLSGSWDYSEVEIDGDYEAPKMANAITVGNFAKMTITGVIENGGVMSATGTTINVGSASTLSVGQTASEEAGEAAFLAIDGLAGLTLSVGKADDTTLTATTVEICGNVTGTEAKNTVSLAANSELTIRGSMDLLGNANAVTVAAKSKLYVEGDLKNIGVLTLGAGGVNKGDEVVTSENASIVMINGNLSGAVGNNKITIGNHAEFNASNIYLSELGGTFTITAGSNSEVSTGSIEGVNKLTISNGIAFAYESGSAKDQYYTNFTSGMVSGTIGNDTISIGNYTTTTIAAISLNKGNDTVNIGNFNSMANGYEADVNILGGIDFGSGKNTLSVGAQSCLNTSMIEGVNKITLAAGKTTSEGNYYTEIKCSGITGSEHADTISIGKLANLFVDGDIDLTYGEDPDADKDMKNTISLGAFGTLEAGDVYGINKLTVTAGKGSYDKKEMVAEVEEWTVLEIGDLTGTNQDDVFSAGNYSKFSVNNIDGVDYVKGDKLTFGMGVTAIIRGTVSNIDTVTIGNGTSIYASTEAMNEIKNVVTDAVAENESIKWYDIGSTNVAKGFTDMETELADNKGVNTKAKAYQNGTNGWLANQTGIEQDAIDYIQLDGNGNWEIADDDGDLNVTLYENTTAGLVKITSGSSSVSYGDDKWTISNYNAETMVVCVEIAKVDDTTKQGVFGYTTTLA